MKLRKRKDGLWTTQVRVDKGKYRSVYGKTQKECKSKAERILVDLHNGDYHDSNSITLSDWWEIWLEKFSSDLKESTLLNYSKIYNKHIKPYFSKTKLCEIKLSDVQGFINAKHSEGFERGTISTMVTLLQRIFRDAVKNGLIKVSPCSGYVLPKEETIKKRTVLDGAKIDEFITTARETTIYSDAFEFILLTGLRSGELRGLSFEQCDLINKTLLVDRQYNSNTKKITSPKSGKPRTIVLPSRAVSIIEKRKLECEKVRKSDPDFNEMNLVFYNSKGYLIKNTSLFNSIKRVSRKIGLPELRVHDLRHTYATQCIKAGVDIKTLQDNLGHSSSAFTLDIYGHSTPEMKIAGAEKLEKMLVKNW